jgi:hypothetical protein
MGFFKSRIEKKAQEYTAQAVERAESSDDPIERTLGPGGDDQVREAMAQFERFGIHLDADSALGLTPTAVVPGASAEATSSPATAASAAPAPSSSGDPIGEIERLAGLHASGALTDEEFAAAKKTVIGE